MPNVIEPASSGRAKCRACQQKIEKGALRFGEAVPNPFGEGEAMNWFHLHCAADMRPDAFAPTLDTTETPVEEREELARLAQQGIDQPKLATVARAERSPTGRARCRHCRETIEKDSLRVAIERIEDGMLSPGGFIHLGCANAYIGSAALLERLERRSALGEDDNLRIKAELSQPIDEPAS